MIVPALLSRMEESDFGAGLGIDAGGVDRFGVVTGEACERTIGRVIRTALRAGDDVLDMEGIGTDALRRAAIFAAASGA